MRKILTVILILLLTSCSGTSVPESKGYAIYFLSPPSNHTGPAFTPMMYSPQDTDPERLPRILITQLLQLSPEWMVSSAFPSGTSLTEVEVGEDGIAKVYFSIEYRELSGIGRVLADYGVVLTLTQLPEISGVEIYTSGAPYFEEESEILRESDLVVALLQGEGSPPSEEEKTPQEGEEDLSPPLDEEGSDQGTPSEESLSPQT